MGRVPRLAGANGRLAVRNDSPCWLRVCTLSWLPGGARAAGARPLDVERGGVAGRVDPQAAHRRRIAHRRVEVGDVHQLQLRRRRGARLAARPRPRAARSSPRRGRPGARRRPPRRRRRGSRAARRCGPPALVSTSGAIHRARRALGRAERAAQLRRAAVRHPARGGGRGRRGAHRGGRRRASAGPRRARARACPPSTRCSPRAPRTPPRRARTSRPPEACPCAHDRAVAGRGVRRRTGTSPIRRSRDPRATSLAA